MTVSLQRRQTAGRAMSAAILLAALTWGCGSETNSNDPQGTTGDPEHGVPLLVSTEPGAADPSDCPAGGSRLTFGYDTDGSTIIDAAVHTVDVCDDPDQGALLAEAAPADAADCPAGGTVFTFGYDSDDSGAVGAVVDTATLCIAENGFTGVETVSADNALCPNGGLTFRFGHTADPSIGLEDVMDNATVCMEAPEDDPNGNDDTSETEVIALYADQDSFNLRGFLNRLAGNSFGVYPFEIEDKVGESIRVQILDHPTISEEWWRGIVQFDLSDLDGPVESAIFRVFLAANSTTQAGDREFEVDLYGSTLNRESSMRFDDSGATDEYDASVGENRSYVILQADFVVNDDPDNDHYEVDVTDFINDRIDDSLTDGNAWVYFRLQPNSFSVDSRYDSRYGFATPHASAGFRPELRLEK